MSLFWFRSLTLSIATCILIANYFATEFLSRIPQTYDIYNVGPNYTAYLHVANVFSLFGVVAAVRQHTLSLLIYAHFLMFDSLLRSIPRFLLYMTLERYRHQLCVPSNDFDAQNPQAVEVPGVPHSPIIEEPSDLEIWWKSLSGGLSQSTCGRITWVVQILFCLGILALTVIQLVAAMQVRTYATKINIKERRQSRGVLAEEGMSTFQGLRRNVAEKNNGRRYDVDEEKLIRL